MARIRSIKPEFWQDEKLAPCDPLTRLVFLGLIGMADDCGRVLDNVKVIDAFIFAETGDSCRDALANLSGMGRIVRGTTASGQRVVQIVNWERHQKVDKPNLKGALPELVGNEAVTDIREGVATDSRESREALALRSTINDQRSTINDQDQLRPAADAAASCESDFERAWRAYPRRPNDVRGKARKAYLARRKAGVSAEELQRGVEAYAAYVKRERTEPRFVKQAATFFGQDEHWLADYGPPPAQQSPGERAHDLALKVARERVA